MVLRPIHLLACRGNTHEFALVHGVRGVALHNAVSFHDCVVHFHVHIAKRRKNSPADILLRDRAPVAGKTGDVQYRIRRPGFVHHVDVGVILELLQKTAHRSDLLRTQIFAQLVPVMRPPAAVDRFILIRGYAGLRQRELRASPFIDGSKS